MKLFKCSRCGRENPRYFVSHMKRALCKDCYISYFEKKVKNTFIKYNMYNVASKVGVALSGGKDSQALLRALYNVFPNLDMKGIYINLGISGYSSESEKAVRRLCGELGVDLITYNLKESGGFVIPDFKNSRIGRRMCGVCGTVKRYLLNRIAVENGLSTVATGHNLDDTVEVLFELYLNGKLEEAVRIRPVSLSTHRKLANRIKPLIELTDEEDLYYVDATDTPYHASWCPLVRGSRMVGRKELIREIEQKIPNYRHILFKSHVKRILPKLDKIVKPPELVECEVCGMPTVSRVCSFCRLTRRVLKLNA
ncbi:MAG TPA: adenine nucleotide alpha hydrolase family protein [Candidatus Caldiarchaeum subterraneum]|uniref:Adenine nucleotide alpha hydrolase family protein n=1 Tax=Caldiarchaeum subterraneum TaxID=311458 RepID=A0A832ZYF8_CALS0|nr:adenine nucleotide alpha hydrolase family protein [Candidatus Caldarchaeum subterraneum]